MKIEKIALGSDEILEKVMPIYETDFGQMVNARELHKALGAKKKFADWIKNNTKNYSGYNFEKSNKLPKNTEEYDYFLYEIPAQQHRGKSIEYMISLDMGKEIAMMSRCKMGSEIRKYFINAEKTLFKMKAALLKTEMTPEERIAEALLLSQDIIAKSKEEVKKANRNKEYNKKVNVKLRREIRELRKEIDKLKEGSSEFAGVCTKSIIEERNILEEQVLFMEGNIELLESECTRLRKRLDNLLKIKIDGRKILNSFATIDVARRQKFALTDDKKEKAKIKAYVFRKESILASGIILNEKPNKSLVDNINIQDMDKAITVYMEALRKLINNEELFQETFEVPISKAKAFLENVEFEKQQEELNQDEEKILLK